MKKTLSLLLVSVLLLALCACGGGSGKTIDLNALAQELISGGVFTDTMSQPAEGIPARIYGFQDADVAEVVMYTGTGAPAEEIFLVKTSGGSAISALKTACQTRIDNQKQSFQAYSPEDVAKLDSAVLVTSGDYVLLVVANDAAAAQAIVDGYIGS